MNQKSVPKKIVCFCLTGALFFSSLPFITLPKQTDAASGSIKIKLEPDAHSSFHDTNGDGFGEFEGFGTSLCWWANRCGYDASLTNEAAKLLYNKATGLGLTIGRYNIGGGDNPSHKHITRSDSKMPGFWSSPKKVSNAAEGASYDAYDSTSGYAWNYNWNADSNQKNVALACQKEAGTEFQAETFSNSAPYFMTVSGCTSGSKDGSSTNLRSDSYSAFATYFTDVTKHLITADGLNVKSISGMNEPESSDWSANSAKQEGCHISSGTAQSKLLKQLSAKLSASRLNALTLAGMDSSGVDTSIESVRKLKASALSVLERIDTHAYMDSNMITLRETALKKKKNLWMSEVDGNAIAGRKAGEMSAALGFSSYIRNQLNGLQPSAWIMWDAIDTHIDTANKADLQSLTNSERIAKDTSGFWGVLFANHNTKQIIRSKKYYAYGQYSRYIRPGYTLIGSSDQSVAAYDTKTKTVVVVITNESASNKKCELDLSQFSSIASNSTVQSIRTSGTLEKGENWKDVSGSIGNTLNRSSKKLSTTLKANSITTYILSNVSLKNTKQTASLKKLSIHQNQISGKNPAGGSDALGNLTDKNYSTEYNCKKGKAVIDLGSKCRIDAISLIASSLNPANSKDIVFWGSNNKKSWKKLFTISSLPSSYTPSYIWSTGFRSKSRTFRYIMFRKTSGKAALTELTIYGTSTASANLTKYPKKLKNIKKLPKKIRLKNKKSAKVISWSFYRGKNDNMTKKQKKTILLTANLRKSLPGYGKTMIKNIPISSSAYYKLLGKTFRICKKSGKTKLIQVTPKKKKQIYLVNAKGRIKKAAR